MSWEVVTIGSRKNNIIQRKHYKIKSNVRAERGKWGLGRREGGREGYLPAR